MMNFNGGGPRPLSKKKTVQLMVILTILASQSFDPKAIWNRE